MRLRAYLVDDEPLAIARLARLLAETGRVDVVGGATVPEEAVAALTAAAPDVCFLDIRMPRLNGFEVLAQLPVQPSVVFTTAHDEYALAAFAVNSVDYLLKPVDPGQLDRALGRVERLRSRELEAPDLEALLRTLANSLRASASDYPDRIASRLGDRVWFIDLAQVTHFFAANKLTYAASAGKSYSVDHTIAQLETLLDPRRFLRIHRSTIVNAVWISNITTLPGGSLNVRLKDRGATDLVVSRDRAQEFKARLFVS
jgi:two-component system LytT family response regulator